jgi:hypothetical protein
MAVTKADLSKLKHEIITSLKDELMIQIKDELMIKIKDELKITIKEEIKDAMREFKNDILGEIRGMQKSIEDLDNTVQENKDEIKSLMDRTKALETQNTQKDAKIKELTDEVNDTQQHQRNFSIRIKGLHVPKEYKDEEFLKYVYTQAIQPTLEFAKLKGELSKVPEYDKVIEHGHILPSRSSPTGSRRSQTGPPLIILRFLSRPIRAKVIKFSYPALNPLDAAKHKWFIPKEYRLSNEKNNQRGNIQINGDLTRRNSELLAALRVEAKKKDKVHKVWTTLNGKIMYASDPESKNTKIMNSLFQKY